MTTPLPDKKFETLVAWRFQTARLSSIRKNKLEDTVVTVDSVTAFWSAVGRALQGAAPHTYAVRAEMRFSQFLNI